MTDAELKTIISGVMPAYPDAIAEAVRRQSELAKPPRSLGGLEDISIRLAGITGAVRNDPEKCLVAVFAADNGVVNEGVAVTPLPREEKDGYYVVYVNVETGEVEDYEFNSGLAGKG